MSDSYYAFVLAAYGMSAVALGTLSLWVLWDARTTARRLATLEAVAGRRRERAR